MHSRVNAELAQNQKSTSVTVCTVLTYTKYVILPVRPKSKCRTTDAKQVAVAFE